MGRARGFAVLTLGLLVAVAPAIRTAVGAEQAGTPLVFPRATSPAPVDPELARLNRSLVRLADQLRPALVQVRRVGGPSAALPRPGDRRDGPPPRPGERPDGPPPRLGLGSGFIVSPEGHVITNYHVVRDAPAVEVRLHDRRRFIARVLGMDARTDLAVLKIDGAGNLPVMRLGDSDALRVGELVMALGNPFGLEESVSLGIVSRKASRPGAAGPGFQFIQTDAAVNPGNSGGPLVNMAGEVVGVNSAASSRGSIGFAIPSQVLQAVAPVLAANGKMAWGWLGVSISDVDNEGAALAAGKIPEAGALVRGVRPGEPAAQAGLRPGDIVLEVNGQPVTDPRDLQQIVAGLPPGRTVPLGLLREGRRETVSVRIGEAPEELQ